VSACTQGIGVIMVEDNNLIQAEGFFPSENRWLFYRRFYTNAPKKGDILAIHGAFEHSGRYEILGSQMAKAGYHFYMLDLSGHGRSGGVRGYINKFEDYLMDIANFYSFLKVYRHIDVPFLFGHSLGGLIATMFCAWGRCSVKSLILSGPFFILKQKVSYSKKLFIKFFGMITKSWELPNLINAQDLCHDMEVVEEYLTDPLVLHKVNISWLAQIFKILPKVPVAASKIEIPTLIFHGENDNICDVEGSKLFFQMIPAKRKDLYLVRDAYHEVFNEPSRGELQDKLLEWLNSFSKETNQS
jgi:alpha-beta hydrolase superfamily lysophospholipase